MARLGALQVLWRACMFGVMAISVLGGAAEYGAYAGQTFSVDASWQSHAGEAIGQFEYDPETGILYRQEESGPVELTSFGKIPGLKSSDLEVLAFDTELSLMVIRHGSWVSILDPKADKALGTNIGPLGASIYGHAYTKILKQPDGSYVVTFSGKAELKKSGATKDVIFIYNSRNETLGWFSPREDREAQAMDVSLFSQDVLKFHGTYMVATLKDKLVDNKINKVEAVAPEDGEMLIDLKAGKITQRPGANFFGKGVLKKYHDEPLEGMYQVESAHEFLGVAGSPQEMIATANPADPKARAAAVAKARERIEYQRGVERDIKEAMSPILGQDEVVTALTKYAQAQLDGKTHGTILFAGPTGVGKTSGFSFFINGWRKALGLQGESSIFYMSLADIGDPQLLESRLKGSTPPYVGADAPSPLAQWMLNNPDGGGLFFDEIEKTKSEVMERLMTFLEKGELALTPHLVQKLCERYKDVPKDKWPRALFEGTNGGQNPQTEIILKLNNRHIIGLGTNAGNETYGDSGAGKELKSEQDIAQANKRFNADIVKQELKGRGYKPEVINRFQAIFAFKKIMKKDHVKIVDARMADVQKKFGANLVDIRFTDAAKSFFEGETYDPTAGARNIERQLEEWLTQNVNDSLISKGTINPGDEIVVDVEHGNGSTKASVMRFRRGEEAAPLAEYTVGKPLPPSPAELLQRARERLQPTLERRIVGHRKEIKLLVDAIITKLAIQVSDPALKGRPIVIYFDGTPGIGKTEIAKGVAEALFDDASRLTRVDFNEIVDMGTLYRFGIEKMNKSIKTNPESQVMLWDELHRIKHTPSKQLIENTLMGVIDEGKLPAGPDSDQKIDMPGATVIMATGNLLEEVIGEHAKLSNRALQADFRFIMRHPEKFLAVFNGSFGGAFRSRLGSPLLFAPLTDEEVAILRDRIFEENTALLRKAGVTVKLTDSAKDFFMTEYVPMEGGRWVRRSMQLYIQNALIAKMAGNEALYQGASMEVRFDKETRKLLVDIKRPGQADETAELAEAPRAKSDFAPEVKEQTAWKTSAHEAAGHALVEVVLLGEDSVAEINTFGGGLGGWVEPNTAAKGREMYTSNKSGIKEIAILAAGHIAELTYLGQAANGAGSDFDRIRDVARAMLIDGGTTDIAPIFFMKDEKTGAPIMSNEKLREIEVKAEFIVQYSSRIAQLIIEKNRELGLTVAKALHDSPDQHMTGKMYESLIKGKLQHLTDAEMESARQFAVAKVEEMKATSCQNMLTQPGAVAAEAAARKSVWQRIKGWFTGK